MPRSFRAVPLSLAVLAGIALAAITAQPVQAQTQTLNFVVDGQSQPWSFVSGGLNDGFQFGTNDGLAPTIVSGANGFDFSSGGTFTIAYVSGLTSAFSGAVPYADGAGDTSYDASDNGGSSGNHFPSFYVNGSSYPVYLNALIGTFADSSGAIVGTPFAVKNGPLSVIAPNGATQLQFGFNDDIFSDNTGALTISVTGPITVSAVPEPGSVALLVSVGIVGAGFLRKRRVRS